MANKIVRRSTNTITLGKLRDEDTKQYVSLYNATFDVRDPATGTPLPSCDDLPLTLVPGTTGKDTLYRGHIPHTVDLVALNTVNIVVTAIDPATSAQREFNLSVPVSDG